MENNTKKQRLFNLPETKGNFMIKGVVKGTKKDNFYTEKQTRTGKEMRIVNFGLEYDEGRDLYIGFTGIEQERAYFYKKPETKGGKGTTQAVSWANRFKFAEDPKNEGFRLIGKNLGLTKVTNEKGEQVNDKKVLTDYDACAEIRNNLKDGESVFVKGSISYRSNRDDKGNIKRYKSMEPSQISLCAPCEFDSEKFKAQNNFNQVIVFMGIEKEVEDDKETGRYVISGKVITYSNIEDVEFILDPVDEKQKKLAMTFRKKVKPYWALKVSGHVQASVQVEEVAVDDGWGEEDEMEKVSTPVKREYIVTGADPSTIEENLYSKEAIEEAMQKIRNANKAEENYGSDSDDSGWGDSSLGEADEEDEEW